MSGLLLLLPAAKSARPAALLSIQRLAVMFVVRGGRYLDLKVCARHVNLISMGKAKTAATGNGYIGEIMVHKISKEIGVVEAVLEAQAGWPPELTIKLKDGSIRKGKLSDFKEASGEQKKKFGAA